MTDNKKFIQKKREEKANDIYHHVLQNLRKQYLDNSYLNPFNQMNFHPLYEYFMFLLLNGLKLIFMYKNITLPSND